MESFCLNYMGYDILLKKSSVKFKNGYGVVHAEGLSDDEDEMKPLIGVVNKKYKPIIPLIDNRSIKNINFFKGGNIIYSFTQDLACSDFMVYQAKYKNNQLVERWSLSADDYTFINDEVIKLHTTINGLRMYALYQIKNKILLTPYYHGIGLFNYNEKYGCNAALAMIYMFGENEEVIDSIYFYVAENGQILSNYYDAIYNLEVKAKSIEEALDIYVEYWNTKLKR